MLFPLLCFVSHYAFNIRSRIFFFIFLVLLGGSGGGGAG